MAHPYVDAVLDTLPPALRSGLPDLPPAHRPLADTLLRFVLGAPCPPDAPPPLHREWPARQAAATIALARLRTNGKREREDGEGEGEGARDAKRARSAQEDADEKSDGADEDDPPLYTLHALSVAAPLRKKLDVRIHARSLRLQAPGAPAPALVLALSGLRRAFLLPTRGKTRAHWTVLLMSADAPARPAKDKARPDKDVQIVFGADALPGAYTTTDHTAGAAPTTHARGTPVLPALRAFLAHVPVPLREPAHDALRVQAYRAAKEGTLWFFGAGLLWDARPAEWWGCADLAREGVRVVSATGRTCSVFVRRRVAGPTGEDDAEGEGGDGDEDEDCVETDFSMVDGREQDGIGAWVRAHRHLFARPDLASPSPNASSSGTNLDGPSDGGEDDGAPDKPARIDVKGKGRAPPPPDEDDEDESDEDFVDESASDGGSATSDSEDGSDGNSGDDDADDSGSDDDASAGEGEDDDIQDLDPARHPLLRPGAVPKMSRAAMDAAVGIVLGDFIGGSANASASASAKEQRRTQGRVPSGEEDEEDELAE